MNGQTQLFKIGFMSIVWDRRASVRFTLGQHIKVLF